MSLKKILRANEYFEVSLDDYEKTGAFNPIIGIDSLFFVDPLLLSKTDIPEFKNSLEKVRNYFSEIIILLKTKNPKAKALALDKLLLKEVKGIGIGYGNESDDGSAIGPELARRLLMTAEELIEMGITTPFIFEIMGLFEEDFGPDRLSDALTRILICEIYEYSERITKEFNIKNVLTVKTYEKEYLLAKNPEKNKPILFIPEEILRDLPVANSFEEISAIAEFNEGLRKKFNSIIADCFVDPEKRPKKSEIRSYLLADKNKIGTVISSYELCKPDAYSFETDPKGLYYWPEKARELVEQIPINLPQSPTGDEFEDIVKKIVYGFKTFIETKGGWRSLYNNERKALNESHAGHFFYATALGYCQNCDIDISPQSNAGQGPVDFKLSKGHRKKIVVEIKLTSGQVLHGYEKQTRIYEKSEEAMGSYYIVVKVTEKSKALNEVISINKCEEKEGKKHPLLVIIDGTKKLSASKA